MAALAQLDQGKIVKLLFGLSILLHIGFFLLIQFASIHRWDTKIVENEIEIDMVADVEDVAIDKKADKPTETVAKKIKISEKMLPQLPKRVAPVEKKKGEQIAKSDSKAIEKESGDLEKKPDEETVEPEKNASNQLDEEDLRKRLAIERLRKLKEPAPEADDLEKIRRFTEINDKLASEIDAAAKLGDVSSRRQCQSLIYKSVRQHYVLPETYGFSAAELNVTIRVIINNQGEISAHEIDLSSGDLVFDNLTTQAVLAAAPFPVACRKFAGKTMLLNFNSNQI